MRGFFTLTSLQGRGERAFFPRIPSFAASSGALIYRAPPFFRFHLMLVLTLRAGGPSYTFSPIVTQQTQQIHGIIGQGEVLASAKSRFASAPMLELGGIGEQSSFAAYWEPSSFAAY